VFVVIERVKGCIYLAELFPSLTVINMCLIVKHGDEGNDDDYDDDGDDVIFVKVEQNSSVMSEDAKPMPGDDKVQNVRISLFHNYMHILKNI